MLKTLTAAALAGAAIITAAPANAAPELELAYTICSAIDNRPMPSTVSMLMNNGIDAGFTVREAAQIVVASVYEMCPGNAPVLQAFAAEPSNSRLA